MIARMSTWQLFVRHAARDIVRREVDEGLNAKGREQCARLVDVLKALAPPLKPKRVLSSPLPRCVETAEAVAQWAGVEVEIEPRLIEQKNGETEGDFRKRVLAFIDSESGASSVAYCSHGDWLPIAVQALGGGGGVEIKKGDFFVHRQQRVELVNGARLLGGNLSDRK